VNGDSGGRETGAEPSQADLTGRKEATLGALDKLRNKLQMGRGRLKQGVGRTTGDPYLEAEGQSDRVSGSAKQVGEQVKDAGRNVKDAFRG
jgi:uncharacterized protein YjbJ (UPF0337 family)